MYVHKACRMIQKYEWQSFIWNKAVYNDMWLQLNILKAQNNVTIILFVLEPFPPLSVFS